MKNLADVSGNANPGTTAALEKNIPAAPIVLISTAMLMFEILQTITLSLQLFDRLAFLVVSFSMLGLGTGGTCATLLARRGAAHARQWLWGSTVAFGLFIILAMLVSSHIQNIFGIIFVSFLPYVPAGLFFSLVFYCWPLHAHRNYFLNLFGSGLGCLVLVMLLNTAGDAALTVWVIACLGLLGSVLLAIGFSRKYVIASFFLIAAVGCMQPFVRELFSFVPGKQKHYGQILSDASIHSRLEWSKWGYLGRLDSVAPGDGIEHFVYGQFAKNMLDLACDFRFLFASGDNWSYTIDFRNNEEFKKQFVSRHLLAAPYLLTAQPDVLNIGLGGGIDVFLALKHGARSVVGVEINPLMIEAVQTRYRNFFDDPYHDPRVTIKEMDGRTYANNTKRKFDVITLSAVDTGAGLAAGANLLSENYLYTQEAFDTYFHLLKEKGFFLIFRPQNQLLRSVVTAVESMRACGIQHPEKHCAVFGDNPWCVALIGRSPLTDGEIERIITLVRENTEGQKIYYLPRDNRASLPYAITPSPYFDTIFDFVARGEEGTFVKNFSCNVSPIRDDSPYYYNQDLNFFKSRAFKILLSIFACVFISAFVLIVLPLAGQSLKGCTRGLKNTAGYFSGIAIGFMFIEIGLIQKLALFLGHPSYSITVTLFSILIFSGVGSIFSARLLDRAKIIRFCIFGAIISAAVCYAVVPATLLTFLYTESLTLRCIIVVALLAPGSFVMGMPFPTMLSTLRGPEAVCIPWAYAINSFASVVASVVAVILSMTCGFTFLLLGGAAFYLLSLFFYMNQLRDTV